MVGEGRQQKGFVSRPRSQTSEDGLQADQRVRDSISSARSVLVESAWADAFEEEEDEGEEIVEAEEQIAWVTEQIVSRGTGDRGENMEEIMQLQRVTDTIVQHIWLHVISRPLRTRGARADPLSPHTARLSGWPPAWLSSTRQTKPQ